MAANICPNCFRDMGKHAKCPHCNFEKSMDKRELYHLPIGTVLDNRYLIGRVLGFGGFGVNYKAWDNELGIFVAIKEFYPAGLVTRQPGQTDVIIFKGGDKEDLYNTGMKRFMEEAQNMSKFRDNPYVVNVFNFFFANNTAYIVMEFLDGLTLKEYLGTTGGKLPYEDTAEILEPIMLALEDLHKEKIIHRDVSPDNIFITIDNRIKLIDFGAAKFANGSEESAEAAVIKPGYAPPEQYQSKSKQGVFTDSYALGATAYRTLTGILPEESIDRAVNDELQLPSELGVELPLNAEKAIMKAMALKPGLRFQRIADMLLAFTDKKDIDFPEIEFKKRVKRRIIAFTSVILAAFLVIGGSFYYYMNYTIDAEKIAEDSITVWTLADQTEDGSSNFKNATDSFRNLEGYDKYTIDVKYFASNELANKIAQAANGTIEYPTVLLCDGVDQSLIDSFASKTWMYYMYYNMNEYMLLKDNKGTLQKNKVIPVAFNIPVAYMNLSYLASIGQEEPESFNSEESINYNIDKLVQKNKTKNGVIADNELTEIIDTLGINEERITEDAYKLFTNKDALGYIALSSKYNQIQNVSGFRSLCAVVPFDIENVPAAFSGNFVINNNATLNQKKLAMLYLAFLSGTNSGFGLPLETEALNEYVSTNNIAWGFLTSEDSFDGSYLERIVVE